MVTGPPSSGGGRSVRRPNAPGAVPALVLGILGLVLCPLLSPFAIVQGARGEQEVDHSSGAYEGRGMATAGKVLGIVGFVWLALVGGALVVFGLAG